MGQCFNKDVGEFRTHSVYHSANQLSTQVNPGDEGTRETKSTILRQASAPSAIETEDLTTIYRIPNEKYQCDQDILNEKGIELLNKIDEGGFAKVFLSKDQNGNKMACKIIDIGRDHDNIKINDIKNELFVLEKVKHPHIIRMHQHFIINDNLYIFMDYANSGNMFSFMQLHGPLPEIIAKKPFAQIVSGVSYMHAQKIAHRDLKLSNILLDSDSEGNLQILIADFGLSRVVYRRKKGMVLCKSYCGTPNYMAPELKRHKRYNAFMVDVYALGVMLFVILNCAYPFNVKDDEKALKEALSLEIQWSNFIKLTEEVKHLITMLLEPNANNRMAMRDLIGQSWFKDEMNDLKYTLPQLNLLPKNMGVSKRLSSPADDIRLREAKRKSASSGSKSSIQSKKSSSGSRNKRAEKSASNKSTISKNVSRSNRSREMTSSPNKSRQRVNSSNGEVVNNQQERRNVQKSQMITMTTLTKRKEPKGASRE